VLFHKSAPDIPPAIALLFIAAAYTNTRSFDTLSLVALPDFCQCLQHRWKYGNTASQPTVRTSIGLQGSTVRTNPRRHIADVRVDRRSCAFPIQTLSITSYTRQLVSETRHAQRVSSSFVFLPIVKRPLRIRPCRSKTPLDANEDEYGAWRDVSERMGYTYPRNFLLLLFLIIGVFDYAHFLGTSLADVAFAKMIPVPQLKSSEFAHYCSLLDPMHFAITATGSRKRESGIDEKQQARQKERSRVYSQRPFETRFSERKRFCKSASNRSIGCF